MARELRRKQNANTRQVLATPAGPPPRRTADEIGTVIGGLSDDILSRRPAAKSWAPKEIVSHLRDVEEITMDRFDMMLNMGEPKFPNFDPDRWAEERQYLRNDAEEALAAFRRRPEETLRFLEKLSPEQWQRVGIHPRAGRRLTFDSPGTASRVELGLRRCLWPSVGSRAAWARSPPASRWAQGDRGEGHFTAGRGPALEKGAIDAQPKGTLAYRRGGAHPRVLGRRGER